MIERTIIAKYNIDKNKFRHALREVLKALSADYSDTPVAAVASRSESLLLRAFSVANKKKDPKAMASIAARLVDIRVKSSEAGGNPNEEKDENGNVVIEVKW